MDTIKFLNKINQEIVKLYENHKPYFQSQLNAFVKRYDQYHKKFAEYRNQALKNSKLIIKDGDNPGEPPKKGWEIQTFGDHLSSHKNAKLFFAKIGKQSFVSPFPNRGI